MKKDEKLKLLSEIIVYLTEQKKLVLNDTVLAVMKQEWMVLETEKKGKITITPYPVTSALMEKCLQYESWLLALSDCLFSLQKEESPQSS